MNRRRLFLLLAGIPLLQALALPGAYLGFEHDDAIYVLAARAIADGGYRFWTMPGHPKIVLFPPGLPLALAPFAWLFPDRSGVFAIVAWAWLAVCDALALTWLRRRLGDKLGVPAFLIFALHPIVLGRVGTVMPEIPYLAWTLLFALVAEEGVANGWVLGGFVSLGWFFRPAAVSMLPAALAGAAKRRDWKTALKVVGLLAAFMLAWRLWSGAEIQEFGELAGGRAGWARVLSAASNVRYYGWALGAAFLPAGETAALILGAALAALAAVGVAKELQKNPASPSAWLLLGWAGMHVFWPWQYERYLVPGLPFVLAYAIEGLKATAKPAALPASCALLVSMAGFQSWRLLDSPPEPTKPDAAYEWIRERAPVAAFASLQWGRDTLYTGRPFMPLPAAANEQDLIAELKKHRVTRVLWSEPGALGLSPEVHADTLGSIERLRSIITRWPAEFTSPDATVYRRPGGR